MEANQVHSQIGQYTVLLPVVDDPSLNYAHRLYHVAVINARGQCMWVESAGRPQYALEGAIEYATYHAWTEGDVTTEQMQAVC